MRSSRLKLPPRWLMLPLALAVLVGLGLNTRQNRSADLAAARAYASAVQTAAQRAWKADPAQPFLEAGSSEDCRGAYRGGVAEAKVSTCTVTRLPNGFEVDVTLGQAQVTATTY
ncbi:hypothetical protein [Deinococcus puniceus]|uniref:Uncharacterized protein n=1 Tax=Deinococcus puniceus TaxID=1182568 RepID=A0A172T9Z3_9DEIO|nr:hypothetical protein [Deinococcus puniceus]ANE43782.1 hypothetical protein SU48_08345 [Deinococcus puniceus]